MSPTVHGQLTSGLFVHSQVVRLRQAYAPPIIYAKLISFFTAKHEGVGGDTLLRRKPRRGSRETLPLTRSFKPEEEGTYDKIGPVEGWRGEFNAVQFI